ncbi:PREDICTED: vomeronasal type-2 receptor 26-like [Nanorana parkeri]|uniref:vomeronasal type-2 receptor 26-like n=1 Tax=Nanorana parkeri TaxID=125878 RepID=UPI000854D554|nr:PREDICTED: vomeronasal type-2 receptor 26-like [Nanorana parkeri]
MEDLQVLKFDKRMFCFGSLAASYRYVLDFHFAIEEVNNDPEILPNVTLGYLLYDSCSNENKAVKSVLQIVSGPLKTIPNYSCWGHGQLAGFIGDMFSVTTIPVAQILSIYGYSQISYGATDTVLSNRAVYPYLLRTSHNDNIYFSAVTKLLTFFSWSWVGILTSGDDSGHKESKMLSSILQHQGICVEFIVKVILINHFHVDNPSRYTINEKNKEIISKSTASVIIVCGTFSFYITRALEIPDAVLDHFQDQQKQPQKSEGDEGIHTLRSVPNVKILWVALLSEDSTNRHWDSYRYVGSFSPWAPPDEQLFINVTAITWKNDSKRVPRSQCSENCPPGKRKTKNDMLQICCYDCVQCSEGEISNITDNPSCIKCLAIEYANDKKDHCIIRQEEYLAYSDTLAIVLSCVSVLLTITSVLILIIFMFYRDTPIIKANNKNLSFILLVSLSLCFLCVFLFIGRPADTTCMFRQIVFGITFSISVSSVLAKTVMVCIAFNVSRPGSFWRKLIGVQLSNSIVLLASFVEVIISIAWLTLSPPYQDMGTQTYQKKIVIECNEGSTVAFYTVLGYLGFLAFVSFTVAYIARNLPDQFNEARYIVFSMLVFCSVWIAMVPTYLSTKGKNMVAVEIFSILTSSAGLLGCIFFPKCYIIMITPHMNRKSHISRKAIT